MAQLDIVNLTGATYAGLESTYGTTPSMTRIFPRRGGTLAATQTILSLDTEYEKLVKRDKSLRGYKGGTASFTCDAWIDATQLVSGASPATTWLGTLLKAVMGGESVFAGSTVTAGSSTSSLVAAAGHGTRFPVGQVFLADVGNVPEIVISKAVATDTITPLFNLSGAPTNGQDYINCHCYYLTDANTQSLTIQHALAQSSAHQWTLNGCTGGLSIDLSRDARMSYTFSLTGSTWTGPSDQSISTAAATNALTGPITNDSAVCLLQTLATTTRTQVPFRSLSVTIEPGNTLVQELGGSTQGVVGVMRTQPTVTAQLTIRTDVAQITGWDSDEDLVLVYAAPSGSGATKRFSGFVLYCTREDRPQRVDLGDSREGLQITLRGRHNTMQSTAVTDLALSPIVLFEG